MSHRIEVVTLSDLKKEELISILSTIISNPYLDYYTFKAEIGDKIASNCLPQWFKQICDNINTDIKNDICVHYLENCPIDKCIYQFLMLTIQELIN